MISSRSLELLLVTVACGALVGASACSKSAESKGNGEPQGAPEGGGETAAGAADDMAPTPVAPDPGAGAAADPGADPAAPGGGEGAARGGDTTGAAKPVAAKAGQASADTEFYTVAISYPETVKVGGSGVAKIQITPKTGWKMNAEFPTKITVTAPADVKVTKSEQKKDDAVKFADKGAAFEVPFTAGAAGDKAFQAKLKFAVCTDATCDPKKEELAWVVAVE